MTSIKVVERILVSHAILNHHSPGRICNAIIMKYAYITQNLLRDFIIRLTNYVGINRIILEKTTLEYVNDILTTFSKNEFDIYPILHQTFLDICSVSPEKEISAEDCFGLIHVFYAIKQHMDHMYVESAIFEKTCIYYNMMNNANNVNPTNRLF